MAVAGLFPEPRSDAHFALIPVKRSHFAAAARLADDHAAALRAGDALHVAICAGLDATLITADRRMREAGLALGVDAMLL